MALVRERRRGGPFASFDDVARRVRGIGPGLVESLRREAQMSEARAMDPQLAVGRDAIEFVE